MIWDKEIMNIKVMYRDGKIGAIEPYELDALISSNKIRKFQRSGKWVTIGVDPIREIKEDCPELAGKKVSKKPAKRK
jgi:hypothetical protein